MKLSLYDSQLNRLAYIGGKFVSCMWSEGYNTMQPFTLELVATADYKLKVKPDCYVGRTDRKSLMVIKTVQVKNGHIIASGKQATRCLGDVAFTGTIVAGSPVASALKAAYDSSAKFEPIEFAESDLTDIYDHQISNKDFLTLCQTMCQETDTGFRVVRGEGQALVELYRPEANPNNILSQRFGNLILDSITLSTENKKNHFIILGEGEGEARFRVVLDLSNGEQKRSFFIDARDILREEGETDESYSAKLVARGYEEALLRQGTWECALKPLAQEFGKRYDLGDVLTVKLPDYGLRLETRISRFTQQSQNNRIDTTIEVGTITITR